MAIQQALQLEVLEQRLVFCLAGGDLPDMSVFVHTPSQTPLSLDQPATPAGTVAGDAEEPSISYSTLANGMPILNSFPTAPTSAYLDFNGGTWDGTAYGGYDKDGDPTTFNSSEQADIAECWHEVAMYFAMFNVNVTTVKPTTPMAWDLISNDYGGGVSFVNAFPDTEADSLDADSDARTRISAIAHELGHNFGNGHTSGYNDQGVKTAEYHGPFDNLHGPIMGLDYSGFIHKWTIWHSTYGVDLLEDDVENIRRSIDAYDGSGDGFRPDDVGDTTSTAMTITPGQSFTGIIERLTDVDMFKFTSTGSRFNVSVGREFPSGVDLKLSILDANGNLVAVQDGDPRTSSLMVNDAELNVDLPAGTYYAKVESHGNYGDQGEYNFHVSQLPSGWSGMDIGVNHAPGFSGYDPTTGTFSVSGGGHNVYGTSDGFQFVSQPISGDATISAYVAGMDFPSDSSLAGVMIRSSLTDSSAQFELSTTPIYGVDETYRSSTAGSTTEVNLGYSAFTPTYVRVSRVGNSFTAYTSSDGQSWTQYGASRTITMGAQVYVGLLASGVDDGARATNGYYPENATFTNVTVTGNAPAAAAATDILPPTTLSVLSATNGNINMSWANARPPGDADASGTVDSNDFSILAAHFGSTGQSWSTGDFNGDGTVNALDFNTIATNYGRTPSGYLIERSLDGVNFSTVAVNPGDLTLYNSTGLADDQRYFYRVRAVDGSAVSAPSPVINRLTRAGTISNLNMIRNGTNELILDWSDASGETGYQVQRSANGSSAWTTLNTLAPNVPMYVDNTTNQSTPYFYRVLTTDASGTAGTSAIANSLGVTFTSKASNKMVISWNSVPLATGFQVERSTDDSTWSTVSNSQTATTFTDTNIVPLGQYYYRVTTLGSQIITVPTIAFAAAPAAATQALPTGWVTADIGAVGGTGAAGYTSGTFTLVGSGTNLGTTDDQFRYAYTTMSGNGWIKARVANVDTDGTATWAGLMIRDGTANNSKYAATLLSPTTGSFMQYRTSAGGNDTSITGAVVANPYWLRITRATSGFSSSFLTEISPDGVTWTTIAKKNVTMSTSVSIGLVVSSQDNTDLDQATFDNVSTSFGGALTGSALGSLASNQTGPSTATSSAPANLFSNAPITPAKPFTGLVDDTRDSDLVAMV